MILALSSKKIKIWWILSKFKFLSNWSFCWKTDQSNLSGGVLKKNCFKSVFKLFFQISYIYIFICIPYNKHFESHICVENHVFHVTENPAPHEKARVENHSWLKTIIFLKITFLMKVFICYNENPLKMIKNAF